VRAASGAPVVWWDPVVLALEVEALAPLRHQRILEADSDGAAAADSQRNYAAWKTGREALLAKASKPSLSVQTVTSLVRSAATRAAGVNEGNGSGSEPRANVERVERGDLERPGGQRFGALVHALLASIDLSADPDAVQAAASVQGRIVGATAQEISAAIVTIGRVLNHPILRRAATVGNDGLRRETPVMLTLDDGSLRRSDRSRLPRRHARVRRLVRGRFQDRPGIRGNLGPIRREGARLLKGGRRGDERARAWRSISGLIRQSHRQASHLARVKIDGVLAARCGGDQFLPEAFDFPKSPIFP
jgi:hypothetical protein